MPDGLWPPKSVLDSISWEMTTRLVSSEHGDYWDDRSGGKIGKCHHHYTLGVSIGTCVGGRTGFQGMPAPYLQMILCVNLAVTGGASV